MSEVSDKLFGFKSIEGEERVDVIEACKILDRQLIFLFPCDIGLSLFGSIAQYHSNENSDVDMRFLIDDDDETADLCLAYICEPHNIKKSISFPLHFSFDL